MIYMTVTYEETLLCRRCRDIPEGNVKLGVHLRTKRREREREQERESRINPG